MTRVLITGVGLVTGLGTETGQTWAGLLAGRTAVGPITAYDASSLDCPEAAEVDGLDAALRPHLDRRALRGMVRADRLAALAAVRAVADAGPGLQLRDAALHVAGAKEISEPSRVMEGVLLARGEDGEVDLAVMGTEGAQACHPLFYLEGLQAACLFHLSRRFGMTGPNACVSGGSEAGLAALDLGLRAIRRGEAERAVVGASDDAASWWTGCALQDRGLLRSGRGGPRPFSPAADGTVLGEASAFLVLESAEAATARGARAHAELSAVALRQDRARILTPQGDGDGLERAVRAALGAAQVDPREVGLVVAEGAGTPAGDREEARAVTSVLGPRAAPVTAVKGALGHTRAASGLLDVAVAALALGAGQAPPVVGAQRPDGADGPGPLDLVVGSARRLAPSAALALAQGFHGQSGAAVLRPHDPPASTTKGR